MKKIGIDCRLAGSKHAGIGRYIEELVKRVIQEETIQWVLFFHEKDQIELPKKDTVRVVIAPIRHYTIREQLAMPTIFAREKLDLLHVPHLNVPLFYRGTYVVTIHDLLWHTQSNANATTLSPLVHLLKYQAYKVVASRAVLESSKIIVPANTVKKDVLRLFSSVPENKIQVIYEGVNEKYKGQEARNKGQEKKKILFYTGSLYPHKNLLLVVKALQKLPEYTLYISSSRSVFVEQFMNQVQALGLSDRVQHLGRLSDEQLKEWYGKSMALVQPSLSEGFGLTGVEAMAAGVPVLASDIPVFHEIYQDACIYFDPNDTESFMTSVKKLEDADRNTWIEKGYSLARKYSWEKMAKETLEVYRSLRTTN